ncbi:MAG: topology modulation protein [Clostridiaceae bacterium]
MQRILPNMNILNYKKIILVGSAGSGKSWLAKRLAGITGYKLIHLDCEFWQPNWTKTPREEWIEKQKGFIKGEKWIIDGNYGSSIELRFTAADLVVFLDINRFVCMWSAIKRHGKKRSDLPDYLEEKMNLEFIEFLKWIWTFQKTGKKKILELHEKYPEKEFLVLKSRKAVMKFLRTLEA